MANIRFSFQLWMASVFGIYSQDFYESIEWTFTVPNYIQQNLTGSFWGSINVGWDYMQPEMIQYLKDFDSF